MTVKNTKILLTLPPDAGRELSARAAERGLQSGPYARMVIMDHLRREGQVDVDTASIQDQCLRGRM